jgi:AcrR family transcriptional regulator
MADDAAPIRTRRSQSERRQESEARLLAAAAQVVAEAGVAAATFEAIGRQAGYSRGLATQRFGSKQGLIEALVDSLHQGFEDGLAAARIDDLPGLEALLAVVDLYLTQLELAAEGQAYFVLMAGAVADRSSLTAVFAEEHQRIEARLQGMIARGQAEGGVRPDLDPRAAALTVGSLLLGVSLQSLIDPTMKLGPLKEISLRTLRDSFQTARG